MRNILCQSASFFVLFAFLGACSLSEKEEELVLFHGACQVTVQVVPKEAHIYIDGVSVAEGKASVNIPCGQKSIVVEKAGYQVHESFPTVRRGIPLDLEIELQKLKVSKNWAMSNEFIEHLESGAGPVNLKDPEAKRLALLAQKKRQEDGYEVVVPVATEEVSGASETQNFEGIDFDDPATWM